MADLDRAEFLSVLAQLANDDESKIIEAAQEAAMLVGDSGLDWSDLIITEEAIASLHPDEPEVEDSTPGTASDIQKAVTNEDALVLIGRLLDRKNLYEGTREELLAYKDDIKANEFEADDLAYLNALYARVMSEQSKKGN